MTEEEKFIKFTAGRSRDGEIDGRRQQDGERRHRQGRLGRLLHDHGVDIIKLASS